MADHDTHDHTGIPGCSGGGGSELDYVEITSAVTVTATTEAGATTVVTANAVVLSAEDIYVEYWFPYGEQQSNTNSLLMCLFDGSTSLGFFGIITANANGNLRAPLSGRRKLTSVTGTKTYSIRAFKDAGTAIVGAGTGGAGNHVPGFIRIVSA